MPIKVAIVGTSNSVMRVGYVSGLAAVDGIEIVANTSIGSSHSILVPMVLEDEVLDQSDFAIFDLTINEQRALNRQMYNLDTMREIFFYILGKCRRHGVVPVFLLMPMRLYEDGYDIIAEYTALCERYSVLHVNPARLAKTQAARLGKTWVDMFQDQHHLVSEVAEEVGRRLGTALKGADLAPGETVPISWPDFTFAPAAPFAGKLKVIDRSTRLIASQLVRMVPGDKMTLAVANDAAVMGIALNMARTNANLRLEGRTQVVKRLTHPYYDPRPALRLVVWQMLAPIQADGERVVLTCQPDSKDAGIESNDHFAKAVPHADTPEAEIAGLVLRSATAPSVVAWQGYATPHMHLTD